VRDECRVVLSAGKGGASALERSAAAEAHSFQLMSGAPTVSPAAIVKNI
jgi:hypothetical protein